MDETTDRIRSLRSIVEPADFTADWLGAALQEPVAGVDAVTRIGHGLMSRTYRVEFVGEGERRSVIAKIPASDPDSRETARRDDVYQREVSFYRTVGPLGLDALPECRFAVHDPVSNDFTLVLEDVANATVVDQLEGSDVASAHRVAAALASIQGPLLDSDAVLGSESFNRPTPFTQELVQSLLPHFRDRVGAALTPEIARVVDALAGSLDSWSTFLDGPTGLQHGDCRLDNVLFSPSRCVIVDWQTVLSGSPLADLSCFLGGSMTTELRRRHEKSIVDTYVIALGRAAGREISREWCHEEYRRRSFLGVLQAIMAFASVEQTERGDRVFLAMLQRHSAHVIDSEALDLLPTATTRR